MTLRSAAIRVLQSVTLAALLLGPTVTPAAKTPLPPSDLTASWSGFFKVGSEHGTVDLTFTQTADSGTFTGTAMDDQGGAPISENGTSQIDDGGGPETDSVTGKVTLTRPL